MESQPQNPEFRNNPENFYSCVNKQKMKNKAVNCDFLTPHSKPVFGCSI